MLRRKGIRLDEVLAATIAFVLTAWGVALVGSAAAPKAAASNLAQEKGRAQVAENEWKNLPKGSQRSAEARELYLRKPQLAQAQAQMLAAQADLNTARDNLERTIIRAPYPALIRRKHSELGQFVAAGSPLADLFSGETRDCECWPATDI